MENDELSYILNHLGENREEYFNAIAPPIIQTSNFKFDTVDELRRSLQDESLRPIYTRGINPTVDILRKKIAALDEAEDALVFSSGATAISLSVMAFVKQGDHIISVDKPYSWAYKLFTELLPRFGVEVTFVDGTDIENFRDACKPNTRVIYLESPNTFTFALQDLEAVAALAKQRNIITIIDNSYCSPLLQKPIKYGIDLSLQSATKYIGGHSDTVAGVVSGRKDLIQQIFAHEFLNIGGIISPFNAWLLLRGLRTLDLRQERIAKTTKKVLTFLENHPVTERILYPMHPSFPQYKLACKQMKDGGGLFSVVLKKQYSQHIEKFCNALKCFLLAVSWGGHESLVIPVMATVAEKDFDPNEEAHRVVRFYIGLETADYLIADLKNALRMLEEE